ncbi:hypothetical protein [Paraburkholderia aromaticivorans]|uniref:hypothetical protein n=1 Tax=Paraburkholderia aromaticivorans TaxID=2026199 RepID=UPI001455E2E2|nr:hypothetical protein [Paraburkholderia aromaticivorans]
MTTNTKQVLEKALNNLQSARGRLKGQPIEAHFTPRMLALTDAYHSALYARIEELKAQRKALKSEQSDALRGSA